MAGKSKRTPRWATKRKQYLAIRRAYLEGASVREVAEKLDLSIMQVYHALRLLDVPLRRVERKVPAVPGTQLYTYATPPEASAIPQAREDQLRHMVALRNEKVTLEEIGQLYGVTRERIRQLVNVARARGYGRHSPNPLRHRDVDLSRLMREIRNPESDALEDAIAACGMSNIDGCKRALEEFGVWPAVSRLYRMRRRRTQELEMERRKAKVIGQLQDFYLTHGRAPMATEMNNPKNRSLLPTVSLIFNYFGSMTRTWEVAGIPPNKRAWVLRDSRREVCKHGHEMTPENTRQYISSKTGRQYHSCKACERRRAQEQLKRRKAKRGNQTQLPDPSSHEEG